MTEINSEKRQLLTGKGNYLGWSKVMQASLSSKKFIIKGAVQQGKEEEEAATLIILSVSPKIAGDMPNTEEPLAMMEWLKS
jgi:hypothetical protein